MEEEIQKLRSVSAQCADLPIVQTYMKECANLTYALMNELGYNPVENYSRIMQNPYNSRDIGFIPIDQIGNMLGKDGSLRELATFTIAIILSEPKLCARLLILKNEGKPVENANLESPTLQRILERMKTFTGLNESSIIELFKECDGATTNCNISKLSGTPIADSTIMSRYTGFPIVQPARNKRIHNVKLYALTPEIIYPRLSQREIDYLKTNADYIDGSELPIKSGGILYEINENTYFNELCVKYKEFAVSGPSTSVAALFHILSLLKNWNIEVFVLMNIAYMCNTPDHSLIEILLPCREYGLQYSVDIEGGTYAFIEKLIDKYSPPPVMQKVGGKQMLRRKTRQLNNKRTKRRPVKSREKLIHSALERRNS
jgi:hypothetical protein